MTCTVCLCANCLLGFASLYEEVKYLLYEINIKQKTINYEKDFIPFDNGFCRCIV